MKHRSIAFAAALLAAGIATAPMAQQPAAPASPAPATPAPPPASPAPAPAKSATPTPKHSCVKPSDFPGNLASDNQRRTWQKSYVDYVECLKTFVKEQQALAEPHVRASNEAIEEHNNAIKDYNAQIEKAKGN
ncbi:MAG TPA: hypothetical protein VJV77_11030 [Casimicrobiaceae bacterium]|nr:hypothetical protein [Casimicrobiaceae bacterium]